MSEEHMVGDVCRKCLEKAKKTMHFGNPSPTWKADEYLCFRLRRADQCLLITGCHTVEMTLYLEEIFSEICQKVCGATIEDKEQFETCFSEHCPMALRMEHVQFAVENGFAGYLGAQFKALNQVQFLAKVKKDRQFRRGNTPLGENLAGSSQRFSPSKTGQTGPLPLGNQKEVEVGVCIPAPPVTSPLNRV